MTASPTSANTDWIAELAVAGATCDDAVRRLHAMLLRMAIAESVRRARALRIVGPEVSDIAAQAADDALVAILAKLAQFRGESAFTTWAYKFVIFEVGSKINRHHWQRADRALDQEDWARLPDRLGMQPEQQAEWRDLVVAVRRAVDEHLTPKQRHAFVALVVAGVPLDALAQQTGSNRNAIYKLMFDARRKIRAALVAEGFMDEEPSA